MKPVIYLLSAFLTYSLAHGQGRTATPPVQGPLTFVAWKQQQVSDAQSQIQKLTASQADEKTLARAREALATTSELTLEEYISVYLPSLQDDRQSIVKLLEQLNKDETADIVNSLLKRSVAMRKGSDNLLGANAIILSK